MPRPSGEASHGSFFVRALVGVPLSVPLAIAEMALAALPNASDIHENASFVTPTGSFSSGIAAGVEVGAALIPAAFGAGAAFALAAPELRRDDGDASGLLLLLLLTFFGFALPRGVVTFFVGLAGAGLISYRSPLWDARETAGAKDRL